MTRMPISTLFVEDSESDVELALRCLEREGFDVAWHRVESEETLRTALDQFRPQVVLSDFTMPGFNGLTALQIVRETAPDMPFIFLSGTIGEEIAIQSLRAGATDYVIKSNLRRLGAAVQRALTEAQDQARRHALEEERSRLAGILHSTSDFVAIFEPDGRLQFVNAAARQLLGWEDAPPPSTSVFRAYPEWARNVIRGDAIPEVLESGLWRGETAILAASGEEIPVSQVIIAHRGEDKALRYFSTIARDIRERKAYEAHIAYLANFDEATGLPNRNLMEDRVNQAIAAARRTGSGFVVMTLDIDRFRLISDGFGRDAGDAILRMVTERLSGLIPPGNTLARIGADTFGIVLSDVTQSDQVMAIARRIQRGIGATCQVDDRDFYITVAVAVCMYPRDGQDIATLLRNAEAAMLRAKAAGPGSLQFYSAGMTEEAKARAALENDLQNAFTRREMQLHYQPQISLRDGTPVGIEALLRWRHREHGWVSPRAFIPMAEASDLIHDLGEFALTTACVQLKDWGQRASLLRMAVNVSAKQFRSAGFVDSVARTLRHTGIDPARIELELTESIIVDQPESALATLRQLKALGVGLAIDDFGTGYSGLNYLAQFPFDCLKIDQSFVKRAVLDKPTMVVIEGIISLAAALGLRVIAEGIETDEQLAMLRSLGCDEAQGFLLSRPVIPAELLEALEHRSALRPPARFV